MPKIEPKTYEEALAYAEKLEKDNAELSKKLEKSEEKATEATEANLKNFKALLSMTTQAPNTGVAKPQDPFGKFKY
jgi:hypothetical protein